MTIECTDHAQLDVAAVYGYIAAGGEESARRVVGNIRHVVDGLAVHPHMGRPGRLAGYQEILLTST